MADRQKMRFIADLFTKQPFSAMSFYLCFHSGRRKIPSAVDSEAGAGSVGREGREYVRPAKVDDLGTCPAKSDVRRVR